MSAWQVGMCISPAYRAVDVCPAVAGSLSRQYWSWVRGIALRFEQATAFYMNGVTDGCQRVSPTSTRSAHR